MDIKPAADDAASAEAVERALDRLGEISTLPEVTLKIIETVEDPDSTARDLHEIVTHDLALSARILRVVNSAFYGLPGQIASIDRAIVLLGLNAVKNIAIAASLSRVFRGGRISRRWTARDLWVHSLAVGSASKMIIERLKMALPDEAFVAGLIHDMGLVVMLQCDPQRMQELMRGVELAQDHAGENPDKAAMADLFVATEARLFGASHEAFGGGLARRWKFPRSFQYVTGCHHRPSLLANDNRLLTQVVHTADALCAQVGVGAVLAVDDHDVDPGILDDLQLTDRQLDLIRRDLPGQVELAMGLFA
ncbi:MAG: hypothetical protein BIFFINMI_00369 [Phycisphaerae bacterium]|nr:hypothetical protein [Phycisphaerae bacterium]